MKAATLETPDGRYIIVRGRLWRKTNPHLRENERKRLVSDSMSARRAVKDAGGDEKKTRRRAMRWMPRRSHWENGGPCGGRMERPTSTAIWCELRNTRPDIATRPPLLMTDALNASPPKSDLARAQDMSTKRCRPVCP